MRKKKLPSQEFDWSALQPPHEFVATAQPDPLPEPLPLEGGKATPPPVAEEPPAEEPAPVGGDFIGGDFAGLEGSADVDVFVFRDATFSVKPGEGGDIFIIDNASGAIDLREVFSASDMVLFDTDSLTADHRLTIQGADETDVIAIVGDDGPLEQAGNVYTTHHGFHLTVDFVA